MKESIIIPNLIHELVGASEDGLSGIVNKLSQTMSLPIIITDSLYNVIITSDDCDMQEIVVSTHFQSYQDTSFFTCEIYSNEQDLKFCGYPITSKNQNLGYIFLLAKDEASLVEHYGSLVQYTASLCSLHLNQQLSIQKERHRFKDAFLFDLLYGNFKNKDDIISYGSIWKWELEHPHVVMVLSVVDYNPYSTDKQFIDNLLYISEKALTQHGIEPILIRKQSEVISLIPCDGKTNYDDKEKLKSFISYLISQFRETTISDRVACGVGQIYPNPVQLFRSYQEAKVAYELGLLLKIEIPFFSDLGLERILYKHDLQDLKEFYTHILGDLQKYDDSNDGELMFTVESLAANQFDLKQTSEAIFVHRNTLRYRIKKIEEILNIKLDDINNRLNITAAIKIKQLHKV